MFEHEFLGLQWNSTSLGIISLWKGDDRSPVDLALMQITAPVSFSSWHICELPAHIFSGEKTYLDSKGKIKIKILSLVNAIFPQLEHVCVLSKTALYIHCQKTFFSAAPVNSLKSKTVNSGFHDNDWGKCKKKSIRKSKNLVFGLLPGNRE